MKQLLSLLGLLFLTSVTYSQSIDLNKPVVQITIPKNITIYNSTQFKLAFESNCKTADSVILSLKLSQVNSGNVSKKSFLLKFPIPTIDSLNPTWGFAIIPVQNLGTNTIPQINIYSFQLNSRKGASPSPSPAPHPTPPGGNEKITLDATKVSTPKLVFNTGILGIITTGQPNENNSTSVDFFGFSSVSKEGPHPSPTPAPHPTPTDKKEVININSNSPSISLPLCSSEYLLEFSTSFKEYSTKIQNLIMIK